MPLVFALLLISGLAACSSKPPPPPQHYFTTETGADGTVRFTFNYIQITESSRTRKRGSQPASPEAYNYVGMTLPGQGPLIDQHQLFVDLEKALDARQLCLEGYRIDQRHPTRRGVSLQGRCL
ncbi:hypothetical protein KUV89_07310 [Marinobacter hydrocarbonoclasticus]|nr:hypothetical protein [Marinobacter nauticus]